MWTKLLNSLGIETKSQREKARAQAMDFERRARAKAARFQAESVITSPQVPKKNQKPKPPIKPTSQVRAEQYGVTPDEAYLNPGNPYFTPDLSPYWGTASINPCESVSNGGAVPDSYFSSNSDSSSSSSSDSNSSYSSSYDSGSSSDSGSSCDSGSSGGE